MTLYVFYFLSFLAVLSALMVVFSRNPIYSVLYLVITFFCVGGHYLILSAEFLFAVHIIVYAGAIMVLFLYVIMLLNLNQATEPLKTHFYRFSALISAGLLMLVIVAALRGAESAEIVFGASAEIGLVKNLGKMLFNEFLLPFEIVSILLLAAMVGAVMLGKTHMKNSSVTSEKTNGLSADPAAMNIKNAKQFTNE
ncbi:MAG: NADH-quinone oxidoreductase subunit J [Cyclobacteriaceae bacterium]